MATLKGKTVCNKTSGEELGVVEKAGAKFVYIDDEKYSRDDVVIVKRSKRPRKGKAPTPETQDKRDKKAEKEDKGTLHHVLTKIPKHLRREVKPEKLTTTEIQLEVFGPRKGGKMWSIVRRKFVTAKEARDYLSEWRGGEPLQDMTKNKRLAALAFGGVARTNYNLSNILKGIDPKKKLPSIFQEEKKPKLSQTRTISKTSTTTDQENKTMTKKSKTEAGEMVVLKKLCQELDCDPRKARQQLRKSVGNTDGRWEWPEGSKEIAKVRAILSGEEEPKAKKTKKEKAGKDKKKPAKKDKKKTTSKKKSKKSKK